MKTSPTKSPDQKRRRQDSPSSQDGKKARHSSHGGKRVTFVDAKVILYHDDLAPLTRFGGLNAPKHDTHEQDERQSRELDADTSLSHVHALELREMIQHLGCGLELPCTCGNLDVLRPQFQLMEKIHAQAVMEFGEYENTEDGVSPWLARKDMPGFEGMGYTFGHRFVTIEQYIATMEDIRLVQILKAHQVAVPPFVLPKTRHRVPSSQLIALHFMNGGRALDQLTLPELRLECTLRNMPDIAASTKHKKSQLVRILKPIFEDEYFTRCAEREQREQMEFLVSNLLIDAAEAKMRRCLDKTFRQHLNEPSNSSEPLLETQELPPPPTVQDLSALFVKLVQLHPQAKCPCQDITTSANPTTTTVATDTTVTIATPPATPPATPSATSPATPPTHAPADVAAHAPADAPATPLATSPAHAPADVPAHAPADVPAHAPADAAATPVANATANSPAAPLSSSS
ncbi:hypothetical protein LEN26_014676 [Aphanomyces euteiches]|nr:hypothetical protein LEN26_014676 [Aphanomyces euteiches]